MDQTEISAIRILARNGIKVDADGKTVFLKRDVGIKLLGVIDYLKNYLKYRVSKPQGE